MNYTVIIVTGDYYPRQEGCPSCGRAPLHRGPRQRGRWTRPPAGRLLRAPLDPRRRRALALGPSRPRRRRASHGRLREGGLRLGEGLGQRRPRSQGLPSALWEPGFVSPPAYDDPGAGLGGCTASGWAWPTVRGALPAGASSPSPSATRAHVPSGRPGAPRVGGVGRPSTTPDRQGRGWGAGEDDCAPVGGTDKSAMDAFAMDPSPIPAHPLHWSPDERRDGRRRGHPMTFAIPAP